MISSTLLISIAVVVVILSIFFSIPYAKQKKRLARELEEKLAYFQEQIRIFFAEYLELKKHYISEVSETEFAEKWQELYTITPFVLGISPSRRESCSTAWRIARAHALKRPSIL